MKSLKTVFLIICVFLLAGCSLPSSAPTATQTPVPPTATALPPTVMASLTPIPPTPTQTFTPAPTFTLTPIPTGTMSAQVSVVSLNLRAGPSTVHEVLGAVPDETALTVLGAAPGYEWVKVELESGQTGWMTADFLDFERDVISLPLLQDEDSQMISGKVIDSMAAPVTGIQVSIYLQLLDATLRTDATTGDDGMFYAYLPNTITGNWQAEITAIGCQSQVVNDNCNLEGYLVYSSSAVLPLPQTSPLLFMYEKASAEIHGFVTDQNGDPISIRVYAERMDGAYAYIVSSASGEFYIPASDGEWNVYAVVYNPYTAGEAVRVHIEGGVQSEEINLIAPQQETE